MPLYQAIHSQLKARILSGELEPGSRLPTEKDLAQTHGVSRITATRALNELELGGFIRRVKGSGSYVTDGDWRGAPGAAAQQGAGAATLSFISLVLPFTDAFSSDVLSGIEDVARKANFLVTFHDTAGDSLVERTIIEDVLAKGSRGIIVYPASASENLDLYSSLLIGKRPFVLLDRRIDGMEPPLVSADNRRGFHDVTAHLLDLGHRRLIFAGTSPYGLSSEEERYAGFCQAHLERGIPLLQKHLYTEQDGASIPSSYLADRPREERESHYLFDLLEAMRPEERPTGIAAANDAIAEVLIRTALERGLSVPGDYSVTGFDNLPFASRLPVPLTTVAQPTHAIGRAAAEELVARIAGSRTRPRTRILEASLVVRQSSSRPRESAAE
jgi:DNA-binding LacI/PurR family transcriptional regulator